MKKHLAIMQRPAIEAILSGTKIIESRFSLKRIPPFGVVSKGDMVYMKPPGVELVGQFRVKKVFSYEGLTEEDVKQLFEDYKDKIGWGDNDQLQRFIKGKTACPYGTLIFIADSERFIAPPIKIKKKDQRGWVVLSSDC